MLECSLCIVAEMLQTKQTNIEEEDCSHHHCGQMTEEDILTVNTNTTVSATLSYLKNSKQQIYREKIRLKAEIHTQYGNKEIFCCWQKNISIENIYT